MSRASIPYPNPSFSLSSFVSAAGLFLLAFLASLYGRRSEVISFRATYLHTVRGGKKSRAPIAYCLKKHSCPSSFFFVVMALNII